MINEIWVVTRPTTTSQRADICFKTTLGTGLFFQYAGGLKPSDIIGFFTNEGEATAEAERQLAEAETLQRLEAVTL